MLQTFTVTHLNMYILEECHNIQPVSASLSSVVIYNDEVSNPLPTYAFGSTFTLAVFPVTSLIEVLRTRSFL